MNLRMNLQRKAILIVAVILFFILAINTSVLTFLASSKYKSAILVKTATIGESLQGELGKVLAFGLALESIEGVERKLQELVLRDKAIGFAMVIDVTGTILFHNELDRTGGILKDKVTLKSLSSKRTLIQTDDSFYDISFPLIDADDQLVGALRIGVRKGAIKSQLYSLLVGALAISFLSFLISLGLIYFSIPKFVTQPIMSIQKAAEKIALGDLTHEISLRGKDEIASLGKAINGMAFNLKDMLSKVVKVTDGVSRVTSNIVASSKDVLKISDVQKTAIEETAVTTEALNNSITSVSISSESLSESAEETSTAIMQMMRSVESVAESSRVFDESAQETASSIEEMVANIKQIAESLDYLSASSEAIASSVAEVNATTNEIEERAEESVGLAEQVTENASERGLNAANDAMEGMENIRKSVSALTDTINMLGKRSSDIGKIVNVINEITDQTNLLSLNAAILAAQAGEHGKSFGVVADNIKTLADRTANSTKEIETLIDTVQKETNSSVKMAAEGIRTVEEGLELVKDVNKALTGIVDSAKASTEMSKAIQRATSEQTQVIKQISEAIKEMTEQVDHISTAIQEQSKGSKFIIDITEKMKDMSHQVKSATSEQRDGSTHIKKAIENVTTQVAQIVEATGGQKQRSTEIVKSMEKIQSTTNELINSSHGMSATIGSLKDEAQNLLLELKKFNV